jgi:hypothetical protein
MDSHEKSGQISTGLHYGITKVSDRKNSSSTRLKNEGSAVKNGVSRTAKVNGEIPSKILSTVFVGVFYLRRY